MTKTSEAQVKVYWMDIMPDPSIGGGEAVYRAVHETKDECGTIDPVEIILKSDHDTLTKELTDLKAKIELRNDEIHTLKNKLSVFEGMKFSENQEIKRLRGALVKIAWSPGMEVSCFSSNPEKNCHKIADEALSQKHTDGGES